MPLANPTHWIGGLQVGKHRYSFDGSISELLLYDRALTETERRELRRHLTDKYGIKPPAPFVPPEPDSFDVLNAGHEWASPSAERETDVCVVGCGSGGVGAVLAAARRGVKVVVVERQAVLGGTGTNAFV
ncbi:MAG: FAD-dependent oxidoreductase, partial [Lentisphaerae bacterium]|nr:FAD-dependent oxidoreductase [Lentisphaerota bacterium]